VTTSLRALFEESQNDGSDDSISRSCSRDDIWVSGMVEARFLSWIVVAAERSLRRLVSSVSLVVACRAVSDDADDDADDADDDLEIGVGILLADKSELA